MNNIEKNNENRSIISGNTYLFILFFDLLDHEEDFILIKYHKQGSCEF